MDSVSRHVLLVNLRQVTLDTIAPLLRQETLDIHTVEGSPFVLDLIRGTPFEILIVNFPLSGIEMDELIAAVREPGSMCHDSGLVLIAEESDLAEAIPWMGRGVNRIVMLEWSRSRIWQTINELLSVAPRLKIDVPVQIALPDDLARDIVIFRTVDISQTGALLSGFRSVPEGTTFTFSLGLPGEEPISGSAVVVRKTDSCFNGIFGVGVRYLSLEESKQEILRAFIAANLNSPSEFA